MITGGWRALKNKAYSDMEQRAATSRTERRLSMSMIDGAAAIEKAVMLYVDGATKNDIALVKQAFDERARLFGGMMDGTRLDIDMPAFLAVLESKPMNGKGTYRAQIVSVQQFGPSAIVVLAEEGCWGDISFVDLLSLANTGGVWKIVNKTFTHTGGGSAG